MLVEQRVGAHPVDLGGRREEQALLVGHAAAHDLEVGFEVELEHAQRIEPVLGRVGDRDQREDDVALLDVVLDPLVVDRDVAFDEVHARVIDEVAQLVGRHVHAVEIPVPRRENGGG